MKTQLLAALAAFTLAAPTLAQDYTVGDITVMHPMTFETTAVARSAGGYLTVTNSGTQDDALLEVRADFPRVMLHLSEEKDGVATMTHQDRVPIPARQTVMFQPGGLHVMFMGLDGNAFKKGDRFPATLVFEQAGELEVTFDVEARGDDSATMDHGAMDHEGMQDGEMKDGAPAH